MENPQTTATPPAAPAKKPRRVGTFTFGLILVAAGVLMILSLILPGFHLLGILKFAPVVLIFLGIEVLIYAAKPDTVVKYDFLSMFACAFILVVVGGASVVGWLGLNFGPYYDYNREQMHNQITKQAYEAIGQDPALKDVVLSVDANVWYNRPIGSETEATPPDPAMGDGCTLNVALMTDKLADPAAFAEVCRRVVAAIDAEKLPVSEYAFYTTVDRDALASHDSFTLSGDAAWLTGMTAAQLAERTTARYYAADMEFGTAADRDNHLKQEYRDEIIRKFGEEHDGEYPGDEYVQQKLDERFAPPKAPEAPEAPTAPTAPGRPATPETAA